MLGKYATLSYIPSPWFFETVSLCVVQVGLELTILLPQPPSAGIMGVPRHDQFS
jgi:hypothetical protein